MKEFRREHNTCYFDGVECSQIVLVTSKGFIRFSDSEFYFKKVKGQYESGQYSDTVMLDVKRGNKNTDISNLKDSRIIPSGSIPYEIRKDTYGDGNWLFLKTDDVVVSYGAEDEGHLYTSRQVQYQITFQGHVFIGVRHTSKTERHQACEEVYNNLEGCLSSYGDTARTRLNAKIDLLDAIVKGHISIESEISADRWGVESTYYSVMKNDEGIKGESRATKEQIYKKYDIDTIMRPYPSDFKSSVLCI